MAQLTIYVAGLETESRLLTLLVDVYAPNGSIVASGTASTDRPTQLELSPTMPRFDRVHVLGRLPNGETLQQTVELNGGRGETTLFLGADSPHEWLQWVTPFRSLSHLRVNRGPNDATPRHIGKVWMTLWALLEGRWVAQELRAIERHRDTGIQLIILDVPLAPHLLQIGGEEVAWRLVSLPPGGRVRVALTRSPTWEGDTLEITVGRSQPDNELIMSYLARGAVAEADRLAQAWDIADKLLYEKENNPVSAAAGAYLLLKSRRLQDRRQWVDNLVEWFPYLADGAIISAALALQREDVTEKEIRAKLDLALERGLPLFAMGANILVETMAAIHRGKMETKRFHSAYLAAQAYARACCSRGAYFEFYGKSPAEPSWMPIYGAEGKALTSPASAEPAEGVVFARPWHGIQAGKFGATRVPLPRAPVSASVISVLRSDELRSEEELRQQEMRQPNEPLLAAGPLFRRTRERGIPILETRFLQEFSMGSERGVARVADQAPQLPRVKVVSDQNPLQPAKHAPRQTSKFWRDERVKNAMPIFDGNE